jgi:hypothetical protein
MRSAVSCTDRMFLSLGVCLLLCSLLLVHPLSPLSATLLRGLAL